MNTACCSSSSMNASSSNEVAMCVVVFETVHSLGVAQYGDSL